jgi:hypothetical protein
MKDNWLVSPEDKLSFIDIDDSPNTTFELKSCLKNSDSIAYKTAMQEVGKKEYICSPYQAQEYFAKVVELTSSGKAIKESIDSLVEYCEENQINYVRFSI